MFERNLFQAISTSTHTPQLHPPSNVSRGSAHSNNKQNDHQHQPPPSKSLDNDHDSNNNGTTISRPVDVPVLVSNDEWGCVSSQEHRTPDVSLEPW
jgi:hypothetical protein